MGPQTQDLYVARGGSPTPTPSNVHRESHRGPPWDNSFRLVSVRTRPGSTPPRRRAAVGEPRRRTSSRALHLSPNPTQHEGGEESRRLGNRCHEKATLLASRHRWAKTGQRVSGGGKREGEPCDRGAVDLASSYTASDQSGCRILSLA